jgi:hypothetical protein
MQSSKLVKGATLKVYPGAPHGMPSTRKDQINADLLAFFKGAATSATLKVCLPPGTCHLQTARIAPIAR